MNATQLLASIKRRAYMPDAGGAFTDAEILSIADESLIETILPLILASREGYLSQNVTAPISALTGGTVTVPPRSLAGALSSVRYLDSNNNLYNLSHIDDIQRAWTPQLQTPPSYWTTWYFQGDNICLWPPPPSGLAPSGSLLITFTAAPNALEISTNANVTYTAITAVDNTVTPTTVKTAYDLWSVGNNMDIVAAEAGHDFRVLEAEVVSRSVVAGPAYVYGLDGVTGANNIQNSDWACHTGVTPVPQCVDQLHTLLALDTARSILDNQKDDRALVLANEVAKLSMKLNQYITPRATNQKKRAINRQSAFRSTRSTLWGTWGR